MKRFILRFALSSLLLVHIPISTSQVVIGGDTSTGISLPSRWQTNRIVRFLNPHHYTLGLFSFNGNTFTLQSNLFRLPPFADFWESSAFDCIGVEYIVLAHGRYLYLLRVKNNRIQKVQQHALANSDQSYSDVQIVNVQDKSYVFVLNVTTPQLHVFLFEEETLKQEPISPYDLQEGINRLHTIVENKTIYLLITNSLSNTLQIYTFKNSRLDKQEGLPIPITGSFPDAIISFRQNKIVYICIAGKLSNTISIFSLINGTVKAALKSPFLSQGIHPTSLLTFTRDQTRYILVSNSGPSEIRVFTFTDGDLTFRTLTTLEIRDFNVHMNLIEYNSQLYVGVYNKQKRKRLIELFHFEDTVLKSKGITNSGPINITHMQSLTPSSQFQLEQILQTAVPQLPIDLARLIAQYTTLNKDSNFLLEKQRLITSFVQARSFNISQALEFIKSARQQNLLSQQTNEWQFLFDGFIFPYYMSRYDMQPIKEWISLLRENRSQQLQTALQVVNQTMDQTSLFVSPWTWFKLYQLRRTLTNALTE